MEDERGQQRFFFESSQCYQLVMQNSDAMLVLDTEGVIYFANPAAETLFGREVAALQQVPFGIPVIAGDVTELDIPQRDGSSILVEIRSANMIWEGNAAILASLRDVTARKQLEMALREAKDAAEAAARVKSEFFANMSHELRTPLNGILGYAHILKRETILTARQEEAVNAIFRHGEHLLLLITDLLEFSQIEMRRPESQAIEIHVASFLKAVRDVAIFHAQERHLEFVWDVSADVPEWIVGDGARLRQVLLHLLSNAFKFTPRGRVGLHISAPFGMGEADHDLTLRFEVRDTGIGIPPDEAEHIFSPFYQASNRPPHAEGIGLGLTICREMLRIMGSELLMKSGVNEGSSFWFFLPIPHQQLFELVERIAPSACDNMPESACAKEPDTRAFILPPLKQLADLMVFADMRNISDLQRMISEMRTHDPSLEAFASSVEALVKKYQFQDVIDMLSPYLQGVMP